MIPILFLKKQFFNLFISLVFMSSYGHNSSYVAMLFTFGLFHAKQKQLGVVKKGAAKQSRINGISKITFIMNGKNKD